MGSLKLLAFGQQQPADGREPALSQTLEKSTQSLFMYRAKSRDCYKVECIKSSVLKLLAHSSCIVYKVVSSFATGSCHIQPVLHFVRQTVVKVGCHFGLVWG